MGEPRFLSRGAADLDYLRIASDSEEARCGTGGAWPDYLGALPPGLAPKDGDWLTRWIKVAPTLGTFNSGGETDSAPAEVRDPPPLDEWLNGRKILLVSQDDRGQFKTIQTAMDAVQPGQAVEVLDRGPYREMLAFAEKRDFGLFSRSGTATPCSAPRWWAPRFRPPASCTRSLLCPRTARCS